MRVLIFFQHQIFINPDSQASLGEQLYKAVFKPKVLFIQCIIKHLFAHIIEDPHRLLLNHGIVADRVQLKAGTQRNGPQWAVRSHGHVIRLRHRSDFPYLRQPAGVTQIGLNDIHTSRLEEPLKVIEAKEALTGSNGNVSASHNSPKALHIFTENGFLYEHGVKFLQLLVHGLMYPAMEINGDPEIFAAVFPDRSHPGQNGIDLTVRVHHLEFLCRVHFNSGETDIHPFLGGGSIVGIVRTITANPGIRPHTVPAGAVYQLVNRSVEYFALDIPLRLVDANQSAHQHAAAIEVGPIDRIP